MGQGESTKIAKPNVIKQIFENYQRMNKMMVEEIDLVSPHGGLAGSAREVMWMKFFRNILPLKYSLAQGVIIIDSENGRSNEVDIAVYDEQYTPYVFQHNTLKFIPIEAVAVAIECKSTQWDEEALKGWSKSISRLKSVPSGIARMAQGYVSGSTNRTQQQTRPIRVLASNFQKGHVDTIERNLESIKEHFDFILVKQSEANTGGKVREFRLFSPNEDKELAWWGSKLNGAEPVASSFLQKKLSELRIPENELLTLNFQLNQLLMLINNPMLFPHFAYAEAFKKIAEEIKSSNPCERSKP